MLAFCLVFKSELISKLARYFFKESRFVTALRTGMQGELVRPPITVYITLVVEKKQLHVIHTLYFPLLFTRTRAQEL